MFTHFIGKLPIDVNIESVPQALLLPPKSSVAVIQDKTPPLPPKMKAEKPAVMVALQLPTKKAVTTESDCSWMNAAKPPARPPKPATVCNS